MQKVDSSISNEMLRVSDIASYVRCPNLFILRTRGFIRTLDIEETRRGKILHKLRYKIAYLRYEGYDLPQIINHALKYLSAYNMNVSFNHILNVIQLEYEYRKPSNLKIEQPLKSQKYSIQGIVDMIRDNIPIEFKCYGSIGLPEIIQVCLYALLLEENSSQTVEWGIIELLPKAKVVKINVRKYRNMSIRLIKECHRAYYTLELMKPSKPKCRKCKFYTLCLALTT